MPADNPAVDVTKCSPSMLLSSKQVSAFLQVNITENLVFMMPTLLSLVAWAVVIMTNTGAACNYKVGIMMTLGFQL